MTVSKELVWLLNQLRNAATPKERLRLLALGYRTLRDLQPTDRRRVAQELGVEGAERLVEQLASRGGASPAVLMEGLRRLESADPKQLGELVTGLIDPDRRPGIVERALDGAAPWLVQEPEAPPPELDTGPAGPPLVSGEPALPPMPPPPAAATEAAVETAEVEPVQLAQPPPIRQEPEEPTGAGVKVTLAPVEEEPAPPAPPVADGAARTAPPAILDVSRPLVQPAPQALEPVAPPTTAVSEARSLVVRLRELGRSAERLTGASQVELVGVLERFPDGWARRRALETLLRAGVPERIEDALALLDTVGDTAGRLWALTTLVATRSFDAGEVEAVLAAAGSSMVERRIRSRLARSS